MIRGFEQVRDEHKKYSFVETMLPQKATKDSAGYDFYSPIAVAINPGEKVTVWTDVKSYMQVNEVLKIYIRSSMGIKHGLVLSNGTGIIDKDYYSNENNDGNIGLSILNQSDETVVINPGDRIAQGIFTVVLPADKGDSDQERVGGIGSTNEPS